MSDITEKCGVCGHTTAEFNALIAMIELARPCVRNELGRLEQTNIEASRLRETLDAIDKYLGIEDPKGGEKQPSAKLIAAAPELLEVLGDLEMLFDKQTYDEIAKEGFDALDDREYSVNITSKQLRAISQVLQKAGA